jgi:hypothetical protein
VRQAIHSLRSGVRAIRWCSTRKSFPFDLVEEGGIDRAHDQPRPLRAPVGRRQCRECLGVDKAGALRLDCINGR